MITKNIMFICIFMFMNISANAKGNDRLRDILSKHNNTSVLADSCKDVEFINFSKASKDQQKCLNIGKYTSFTKIELSDVRYKELQEYYSDEEISRSKIALDQLMQNPEIFKREYKARLMDNVPEEYQQIVTELAYVQVMGAGMMALIYAMPESINNWNKEELANTSMVQRYKDNIAAGPIIDQDHWAINYIGHPLSGSAYYVWGRNSGLSWQESAGLSFMMSTFFWEYGWEALGETPSIQDLIFTPLIGSIMGEGAYRLHKKIIENDGKIYSSKILGDMARGFLDPIGELNAYIDILVKKIAKKTTVNTTLDWNYETNQENEIFQNPLNYNPSSYIGFKVEIKFIK